jgi:serine/threonine protein kinase
MISRALPFHSSDRKQTFKLIKEAEPDISGPVWDKVSKECKDLLLRMLTKDPSKRITVDEALVHPVFFFHGYASLNSSLRKGSVISMSDVDSRTGGRVEGIK